MSEGYSLENESRVFENSRSNLRKIRCLIHRKKHVLPENCPPRFENGIYRFLFVFATIQLT